MLTNTRFSACMCRCVGICRWSPTVVPSSASVRDHKPGLFCTLGQPMDIAGARPSIPALPKLSANTSTPPTAPTNRATRILTTLTDASTPEDLRAGALHADAGCAAKLRARRGSCPGPGAGVRSATALPVASSAMGDNNSATVVRWESLLRARALKRRPQASRKGCAGPEAGGARGVPAGSDGHPALPTVKLERREWPRGPQLRPHR